MQSKKPRQSQRKRRPALSPEAQEQRMISLAINLAEQQLEDGTASAQIITHYLKLATDQARIENEKLRNEVKLLEAKTKAIESEQHRDELYMQAIQAMREYTGSDDGTSQL